VSIKVSEHMLDLGHMGKCTVTRAGDVSEHVFEQQSRRAKYRSDGMLENRLVCVGGCGGVVYDWDGPVDVVLVGAGSVCSVTGHGHEGVREDRLKPDAKDASIREDRLVCKDCGGTIYPWTAYRLTDQGRKELT